MKRLRTLPLLLSLLINTPSSYADNSEKQFAAGEYTLNKNKYSSLFVASSENNGKSWSLSKVSSLPEQIHDVFFHSSLCDKNICINAGSYETKNNKIFPLLTVSQDNGNTWSFVATKQIDNFPNMESGALHTVVCNANAFIIGGYYKPTNAIDDHFLPVLLSSTDHGATWKFINSIENLPASYIDGQISKLICTKTTCLATGSYIAKDKTGLLAEYPLILTSHNNGQSWSFIKKVPQTDYVKVDTQATDCHENICLMGGSFKAELIDLFHPFLWVSKDAGESWSAIKNIANLNEQSLGDITNITYKNNNWIAVGAYFNRDYKEWRGTILVSQNNGSTWDLKTNYEHYRDINGFDKLECNDNTCITVSGNADQDPWIVISHDNGLSWKLSKNITDLSPIDIAGMLIESAHCNKNLCLISGKYFLPNSDGTPLLLTSNDSGESWQAISTMAGLPNNIYSGSISATTIQ